MRTGTIILSTRCLSLAIGLVMLHAWITTCAVKAEEPHARSDAGSGGASEIVNAWLKMFEDFVRGRQAEAEGNDRLAAEFYRRAAEKGHPESQERLADLYQHGRGISTDPRLAKFWYKKAARAGRTSPQQGLLDMLPTRPGYSGLSPWFVEPKNVRVTWDISFEDHSLPPFAGFTIKVPASDGTVEWEVVVPVHVFSAAELDADDGLFRSNLKVPPWQDLQPPDASQVPLFRRRYPRTAVTICYPPYVVLAPSGIQISSRTEEAIEQHLETYFESASAMLAPAWGKWRSDGCYYSGAVVRTRGNEVLFRFNDGQEAWLTRKQIFTLDPPVDMLVEGNWRQLGTYYRAKVIAVIDDGVRIRYHDGFVEDTTPSQLRIYEAAERMGKTRHQVEYIWRRARRSIVLGCKNGDHFAS